ncbi:MAG: endopeptidase La [Verrucomicrobia bacterium]|jgi:ATP-dependent Lon protease|nr:endopeptidase La [Verrucomicrobiota bacterium]
MTSSPDTEFISILGPSERDGAETRFSTRALPDTLPILGLSDVVFFPSMVAPLLVEAAGSIKLIDDVVGGDRLIGVALQRNPNTDDPGPEEMHGVGCAARVLKMLKFPDNTVRVLVEGLWRVRIKDYTATKPYLRAKFELLRDISEDAVEETALLRNAQSLFQDIIKLSPALSEQVKASALNTEEPGQFADLAAINLNLALDDRQALLETVSIRQRLQRLLPLMNQENQVLVLSSKIQSEVATNISKTQRDFFLREQMRAIQRELGEGDHAAGEIRSLREKVQAAKLSAEARKVAEHEVERLSQIQPGVPDYSLTRNYIDWILALPWETATEDKLDLDEAERILNEQHFGLSKVKERLLEFLAVIKRRKQLKGPILCLVGPPGVGKTSLGRSVADALGRKFGRIALGGMRDEAEIRGHRRTYVGALPGRIIQTLRRLESRNPVILLDELDKVGADFRGDPAAALLEVLDPEQNNTFTDHYLDLPFDLSRVLFLTTANWLEPVHPALRDRLEVIELPSYTETEKLEIAKRHLIPRQLEEHGLSRKDVRYPDAALRRLITGYTREAGVRQLDREIAALTRKVTRRLVGNGKVRRPLTLSANSVAELLGPVRFHSETAEKIKEIGIATGLVWTPVGGEVVFIEATRMPGKGNLLLTGLLGDVMKESAQTALSYLRSQGAALGLESSDHARFDIHIHVPAGAVPKDGPSAGVTITAALASLLTGRRVRSDLAMTGEVSLRGRVLRVGGVKEKVLAAARFGLKELLLPDTNSPDWQEVPAEVRKKLKVHFIRHISQLLPLALEKR